MTLDVPGFRMCQQDVPVRVVKEFHWNKAWSLCSQAAKKHYITQQYIHAINTHFFSH